MLRKSSNQSIHHLAMGGYRRRVKGRLVDQAFL
jgi:hypothetical protein